MVLNMDSNMNESNWIKQKQKSVLNEVVNMKKGKISKRKIYNWKLAEPPTRNMKKGSLTSPQCDMIRNVEFFFWFCFSVVSSINLSLFYWCALKHNNGKTFIFVGWAVVCVCVWER